MDNLFSPYYKTVKALIKLNIPSIYDDFVETNISEVWVSHDNWDGGIDYYNIVVGITVEAYTNLLSKTTIADVEKTLFSYFTDAMRGEDGSIRISEVIVRPDNKHGDNTPLLYNDSMWLPNYFRLFVSHLSSFKTSATHLKLALLPYGINCFVAHEDIKPSKEWEIEIENALFSMNALCAIVTKDFILSEWCDQEIGFALGQKKVIIPVIKDALPHGFFGKYQAIKSTNKASEVAKSIWETITKNEKTSPQYSSCLISLILAAQSKKEAINLLTILQSYTNVSRNAIETLYKNWSNNNILIDSEITESGNKIFARYSLSPISFMSQSESIIHDEDLPF